MDKYTFLEKIGRGTHGTVYLLQSKTETVVCKSIPEKNSKYALREISFLEKLNHKRIIALKDHILHDKSYYLILEHANHGTLENILNYHKKNNLPMNIDMSYQKLVYLFLAQLSDALFYLHSKKIIHRDIKPSNILVNQFFIGKEDCLEFKLCDFSLSTNVNMNTGNLVGTPYYMAPEIIKKEIYDERVDIWSLGVVLYEMVSLKRPFNAKTRKELQINILKGEYEKIEGKTVLSEVVEKCLEMDFKKRINASEIRRIDRVRYNLALCEIKLRDKKIIELEDKIKALEGGYFPTPDNSIKKST